MGMWVTAAPWTACTRVFTTSISNCVASALMEFPPAYVSLIFPLVITCYFAANSFSSSDTQFIKDYFMLRLRFQISAASQSSHPGWVVAKIYLQRENHAWDSTSLEHSVLLPVHPWNIGSSREKDWVMSALKSQDCTKLRMEECRRAESCCSRGSAAQEWRCQLVTQVIFSAAAESCTCIPALIWSDFTIILLGKVFYPFHLLHESRWRKVTDKEMLMVHVQSADSALGEQPNNK